MIEGFYGPPWSWDARDDAVDFLATRGFNAYLYAPKSDPLHRDRWREPYLPEEQERFAALSTRCRDAGIAFVFGLSPLRFGYDDDEDLSRLLDKSTRRDRRASGTSACSSTTCPEPWQGSGSRPGSTAWPRPTPGW
jgi:hyaluronoglucosaminidase